MTLAGIIGLLGWWILCALVIWRVITYEDREQERERIARAQGFYPPVRPRKHGSDAHLPVPQNSRPSTGEDERAGLPPAQ